MSCCPLLVPKLSQKNTMLTTGNIILILSSSHIKRKLYHFVHKKKKKPFDPLSFASLPRQVPIFFSQRTAEIELCLKPFPCFSNKKRKWWRKKKLLSKERNKLSPTGVHRVTQVCSTRWANDKTRKMATKKKIYHTNVKKKNSQIEKNK